MTADILSGIRRAFEEREYYVTVHALHRMLERRIPVTTLREAIVGDAPEVIEHYPNDARGASCLILCSDASGVSYHVQCSYSPEVWLVTAYQPARARWTPDLRRRLPE